MARLAVIALVFAGLMAVAAAQNVQVPYTCDGAKQIGTVKNACNLLCKCAGALNSAYQEAYMQQTCINLCNQCNAAAQKCKSGEPLPQACAAGKNIKEVNQCITTFLKSRSG